MNELSQVHDRHRRAVTRRRVYFVLALLLDVVVLGLLACLRVREQGPGAPVLGFDVTLEPFHTQTALWFSGLVLVQIVLGHWGFRQVLAGDTMISLYPKDASNGERFGSLTAGEIVALVQEAAQRVGVRPIDRIVMARTAQPNAYTARILGLGTVVVLHSNVSEILNRDELRAVIAHEIGHIDRNDSVLLQLAHLPQQFRKLVGFVLLFKVLTGLWHANSVGEFLTRAVFLYGGWQLAHWLFGRLQRLANLATQQAEYLADACAARAYGVGAIANALLRLGERSDTLQQLQAALMGWQSRTGEPLSEADLLRLLERFPRKESREDLAHQEAPYLYVRDRLESIRERLKVPFSDEQIEELSTQAAEVLRAEASQEAKPDDARQRLINWRQFDYDASGHLDRGEMAKLANELRRHPGKMIFRQFLQPDAAWQTHPPMRERILFLYEVFLEGEPSISTSTLRPSSP